MGVYDSFRQSFLLAAIDTLSLTRWLETEPGKQRNENPCNSSHFKNLLIYVSEIFYGLHFTGEKRGLKKVF